MINQMSKGHKMRSFKNVYFLNFCVKLKQRYFMQENIKFTFKYKNNFIFPSFLIVERVDKRQFDYILSSCKITITNGI